MHVRRQIREAVIARLGAVEAFAGKVVPYRVRPATNLPSIEVVSVEDAVTDGSFGSGGHPVDLHEYRFQIVVRDKAADDLDDALDGHCALIEAAMETDDTFGGLALGLACEKVEFLTSGDAERPSGAASMAWRATYRIVRGAPETAIG